MLLKTVIYVEMESVFPDNRIQIPLLSAVLEKKIWNLTLNGYSVGSTL